MSRDFVCRVCKHIGVPRGQGKLRGSLIISTILWMFVLPGLLYSIWRRTGKGSCKECGSSDLASMSSDYGKIALEEFYMKEFSKDSFSKKDHN